MTAVRLTYVNQFTQAWQNLKDLIDNRSNVPDPSMANNSSSFRKFVYTRDPDVKGAGFDEFPYIVLPPADVSTSGKQTLDARHGPVGYSVALEVVTCDRNFGNRDGQGATDNDTIANEIFETLNDVTNRATLRSNGMVELRMTASPAVPEPFKETLCYRRTITITFATKMATVSA